MHTFTDSLNSLLGLDAQPQQLTFLQMALRAIIVFIIALAAVRLGDRRFLSKKTAFDAILGFILASMLARAINGSCPFFATLGTGFVLVGLHWALAYGSCRSHWFGNLVKGRANEVIKDGIIISESLRRNNLSQHDLLEDLRFNGGVDEPQKVKSAYLERNGHISVVKLNQD